MASRDPQDGHCWRWAASSRDCPQMRFVTCHSRDEHRNPCLLFGVGVVHLSGVGIEPKDVGLVGTSPKHRSGASAVLH